MKENLLSVSETSEELAKEYALTVTPHALSNLIYRRVLAGDAVRFIGGRKMISAEYLPTLAAILRERGAASESRSPSRRATG